MTVKLLTTYGPYLAGDLFQADANKEAGLVKLGMATADTTGGVINVSLILAAIPSGGGSLPWHLVTSARNITAGDDGQFLTTTTALTLTVPSGLSPRPTVCLLPPVSGQLTLTGNINGSVQSIAIGPAAGGPGWCLCANIASDGYTLLPNH